MPDRWLLHLVNVLLAVQRLTMLSHPETEEVLVSAGQSIEDADVALIEEAGIQTVKIRSRADLRNPYRDLRHLLWS